MKRRAFFVIGGQALVFALAPRATRSGLLFGQQQSQVSPGAVEQRLASVIQAYDAQGNHRTGTEVDKASAEWLANQVRQLGAEPSLEPFTLSRVDPQSCYLRVAGRRIDGVPLFDASFTGAEGVHGRLGPVGSDGEIGLAETAPFKLTEPGTEQRGPLSEARHSRHKAVVLLTRGSGPGLFLINASAFTKPFGPPMLQVSSAESEWLKEQAQSRGQATLIAHVNRTAARAFNVTAKIAGRKPTLAPLVLMTPRSGWWQCASERGGGLACWLEAMRVLAAGKPTRDCFFVALSGHEVGFLGIDAYIKSRPDLMNRAYAWIHFGANIGAPRQPNLIYASDSGLEQWAVAVMEKEGLTVDGKAARGSTPRAEAGAVHRGGGRYIALVCGSEVFHNTADRWPEAVDVAILARYAKAFANGALELAQQSV